MDVVCTSTWYYVLQDALFVGDSSTGGLHHYVPVVAMRANIQGLGRPPCSRLNRKPLYSRTDIKLFVNTGSIPLRGVSCEGTFARLNTHARLTKEAHISLTFSSSGSWHIIYIYTL